MIWKTRVSPLFLLFAVVVAGSNSGCGGGSTPPPIALSVSPASATVPAGGTQQFTALMTNDTAGKGVTWTISPAAGAGTLSSIGETWVTYNAPTTPPSTALNVTITATSVADPSKTAAANITIPPPSLAVSVAPTTATVQAGGTAQFVATVTTDPANKGVNWTVACASSPCGTLSATTTASGVATTYTASFPQPLNSVQVTITATSVSDSTVSSSATITIPGVSVTITPASAKVGAGSTTSFTATVSNDPSNSGTTWTLSFNGTSCSPGCGTLSATSSASGTPITYSAPSTPPASDEVVTITATSVSNPSAYASAGVTLLPLTVSTAPAGALLPVNIAQQFTATVTSDAANQGVTWTLTQGGTACSSACGTISSTSSVSGTPIDYTAPAKVPAIPTVDLTATSVTDSTKSAGSTITVSAGTVELVPNILDFGTKRVNSGNSPPQTATLTNTGNSALGITNITITGANAADFSQSNTCATSIGAGNNCTFSVTFNPTGTGLRSANISISDSSADSPQQISLSGTGSTRGAANSLAVRSALAQEGTTAAPIPVGPDQVGTRIMDLVDSTRDDPYQSNGRKRELLVRFWYPASLNRDCQPAQYTSPKVWNYFSKLVGVPLPEVTTNSCWNAPVLEGAHPIVVFTPGYTATFTDYTFLFEDLASRGYVVASVDHTYEATGVEFPDGRFAESVLGSHLGDTWRGDHQTLAFVTSVRLDDLRFVANELGRLNLHTDSPFAGKLDTSHIAIAGHSMGGATAFLTALQDSRFRAAVIIDSFLPRALVKQTQTPALVLAAGREKWSNDECRLWSDLRGPRLAVNLKGAEHETPSDAVWLMRGAIKTGEMGADKTVAAIRDYIASFLDATLRDKPLDPLLTGPSLQYPDAVVTTREQALCRQP